MNKSDYKRNFPMLRGRFSKKGYDWWWHNFTGVNEKTGEERTFFVEYFTVNPKLGGKEVVLGQLPENKQKKNKPSYCMIKCGWWGKNGIQLHKFIPWSNVVESKKNKMFSITADDCFCNEKTMTGNVKITKEESENHPEYMCDFGTMEWNLQIEKEIAFNVGYGAGNFFRFLTAFEMYWHAEGMKSKYKGTVIANGEKFIIKSENSFGYADKNWGADFTSPWVWLSSNDLKSKVTGKKLEDSVFDIGGGRPKAFGIALNRKLLSDFWYEGKSYEFNFSKFWTGCKTEFDCKETENTIEWFVKQENLKNIMETKISCKKEDMLLVNYESPDGEKRHNRLWNGGTGNGIVKLFSKKKGKLTLIDEIEAMHVGCEYGEYSKKTGL